MNCDVSQRRLLALAEPDQPPPALQEHLEVCPLCQEMQRRLLHVERQVPLLPVPPSSARAAFVERFRNDGTVLEKIAFRVRELKRWQLTTAAIAASLLLFVLAWTMAPKDTTHVNKTQKPATPDKLLASLLSRNLQLAVAESPRDQLTSLADLAEDLRGQSQPLVWYGYDKESKDALKDLADWYGQVIRVSVGRAGHLKPEQRRPVLDPIIRQWVQASEDAEQLARETNAGSMDHPLFTIAFAAKNGKDQLDTLLKHDMADAGGRGFRRATPAAALAAWHAPRHAEMVIDRIVLSTVLMVAISPARGDDAKATAAGIEQAQRFGRNRKLIHALVDNCVRLAEQKDFVSRAESCTRVADQLAEELQQAAGERDLARASEFGRYLKDLLVQGVAFNLTSANREIPVGGLREPEMLQIGDHVKRLTDRLEDRLGKSADKDTQEQWQRVAKGISDGRAEVYRALKGRGTY